MTMLSTGILILQTNMINLLKFTSSNCFFNSHTQYSHTQYTQFSHLLKEKMSACILWATNLCSVVQFPYSPWYNSAVLKHKKRKFNRRNIHTKYHCRISYHSLNIIKKPNLQFVGPHCFKD